MGVVMQVPPNVTYYNKSVTVTPPHQRCSVINIAQLFLLAAAASATAAAAAFAARAH